MNSDRSILIGPRIRAFFENPPETLTFTLINNWIEKIFCYGFCRSGCRSSGRSRSRGRFRTDRSAS